MLDMKELLAFSVEAKASDVHIAVGIPPKLRINGKLTEVEVPALSPADAAEAIGSTMKDRHKAILQDRGEVDFSFDSPETVSVSMYSWTRETWQQRTDELRHRSQDLTSLVFQGRLLSSTREREVWFS